MTSTQSFKWFFRFFLVVLVLTIKKTTFAADLVAGNLIQFNENGAWCWYQDPRVLVDSNNNTILISSIAAAEGFDGNSRSGDVDVVTYHLDTGLRTRFVLCPDFQPQDDHNAAALLIRPDGRYLAMYARHNHENLSYWRISTKPHDASDWGPEQSFDWTPSIEAAGAHSHVTYSNLFYLSAENRTYNFSRAINDDPSILTSTNQGDQWSYAGKLLTEEKLGYVNGYTKYASNGRDRIDFITTEHHPRDFNNSIYHGYIQAGKLHRSDGSVVDKDIFNSPGHSQTELTTVFAANSMFDGTVMTHAWTISLELDPDGQPCGLISARANDQPDNTNFNDHRFFYVRFDGKQWQVHQLAKAGACLWRSEEDYTGLAALDPSNPNVVFISTTVDPRNDATLSAHEIFQGKTTDAGKTWAWTPITQNSTIDNLRPIVAAADANNSLVLWFRGTMSRSQHYDSAIVGAFISGTPRTGKIQFVPASPNSSSSRIALPAMKSGAYDLFAFFWSDPTQDQQIDAGLANDQMMNYRSRSAQQADPSQFAEPVKVTDGNRLLYRAWLGRITAKPGQPAAAFVDEPPPSAGKSPAFAGLGYAQVPPL